LTFKWRDNSIRIISVLIAVLLWIYVTNEQNPVTDMTLNVPLVAENEPSNIIIKGMPKTVSVRVKGTRSVMGTIQRDVFSAYINLADAGVGEQELPVQLNSPPGVEVLRVSPQVVRIQTDRIIQKNVPVVVSIKGDVAKGQQVGDPVLKPQVVAVQGPGKVLDNITQVGVTVDVTGADDTLEREVAVETGADGVTVNPGRVLVTVPVTELPIKSLPVRLRITGEPAAGYIVSGSSVQPSSVQVTGRDTLLQNLTAVSTMFLDITGVSDDVEREVVLMLPDGVKSVEPEQVMINVQIQQMEEEQQSPGDNEESADRSLPLDNEQIE